MKSLEQVIQNKFLISKNYKRVFNYEFINPSDMTFDELSAFIIYDLQCENIIEFIKLLTPFVCYISSLLKYEDRELYINDKIFIRLEFHESQSEYFLDMISINDENGIRYINEYMNYFNDNGFYLTFAKKFVAYFIIYDDSEENDSHNRYINTNKTFKTEECLICTENIPNVIFCGCGHLCVCDECVKTYRSYKCPMCKHTNKNIRILI